jgi:uncharacterized membrane protein YjjP (DUF1212 family)
MYAAAMLPPAPPPAPGARAALPAAAAGPESDAVLFVLRLGRALHACGAPAPRVEEVMGRAAERLGLEGQFFTTPTSIFAGFGPDGRHTRLLRVEPGEVHLERLSRLDEVIAAVDAGRLAPDQGLERIERIVGSAPRFGTLSVMLANAVASAAAARILGAGARGVAVAAGLGALVALMSHGAEGRLALQRVLVPLAAFAASAVAALGERWAGPFPLHIVTLAGIIVLLPGLALTVAMTEVSTNHLVAGTARLTGAFITLISLVFGVAMGHQVAGFVPPATGVALPLAPWTEWLAVAIAPLAFGVLLRARVRDMGWILATALLTFLGGRLGARLLSPELGVFVGALVAGVASNLRGRWLGGSPAVTLAPSLLVLVPGSIGFRSLLALLDREVLGGIDLAFRAALMFTALVAGVLIANVAVPAERRRLPAPRAFR